MPCLNIPHHLQISQPPPTLHCYQPPSNRSSNNDNDDSSRPLVVHHSANPPIHPLQTQTHTRANDIAICIYILIDGRHADIKGAGVSGLLRSVECLHVSLLPQVAISTSSAGQRDVSSLVGRWRRRHFLYSTSDIMLCLSIGHSWCAHGFCICVCICVSMLLDESAAVYTHAWILM